MRKAAGLVVAMVVCFTVAAIGGFSTAGALRTWYPTLTKPLSNPPNRVFGPVWSLVYAMMAVSVWRVWVPSQPRWCEARAGVVRGSARAEPRVVDRLAAILLLPYLAWVSFASDLNHALRSLNS